MEYILETIVNVPFVIRIMSSLLFILLLNRFIRELSVTILAGTFLLALWCGHSFSTILTIAHERLFSLDTFFLLFVIYQVITLSSQMSESGVMKDLVDYIKKRVSRRTGLALIPAVIGLLPMPGGAIFSAPLVDDFDEDKSIDPHLKTKINYWFRHIWEYWWPLYPGVILAIDITGLPVLSLMVLQLPLSIFSLTAGFFFLLKKIPQSSKQKHHAEVKNDGNIAILIMPVLIIITLYGIIHFSLPGIVQISKYLPMIIGICIAQAYLQFTRPLSLQKIIAIIITRKTFMLVVLVSLIRIYGAFIETQLPGGELLMDRVRNELMVFGIPGILIVMLIPFISGISTGIALGFVGASFPVVMAILGTAPALSDLLSTTVLAYASGYMGMMLSPIHVCFVVTNQYFRTSLLHNLIGLIRPALSVICGALLLYGLIRVL